MTLQLLMLFVKTVTRKEFKLLEDFMNNQKGIKLKECAYIAQNSKNYMVKYVVDVDLPNFLFF